MVRRSDTFPKIIDREQVAEDWRARGMIPGQANFPPGRERREIVREADEWIMVVEGEVEVVIEGCVHRPEPGEELCIPAGAAHSIRNPGTTTSRWLFGYQS